MKIHASLLLAILATSVYAKDVVLKGGAKIQAPLLKDADHAVVLDLGYDVLRIPRDEVLAIYENLNGIEKQNASDTNRIYTLRMPERTTTFEAAKQYGPAVVLVKTAGGLGSGFFINKKGYLITNFHVICGEKHITVTQFVKEGKIIRRVVRKDVEIIATAPFHDLAILRVKDFDTEITPVIFSPEETLRMGETVFAIGNPLGLERSVTEGVLSQTHRNFGGILYLQIDAPVNPGNSGGPLFNARGQVVGIINMGIPNMEGLNFAIPTRHAKYILDHMDAFAYDASNSESGYIYPDPPRRLSAFSRNNKDVDDEN